MKDLLNIYYLLISQEETKRRAKNMQEEIIRDELIQEEAARSVKKIQETRTSKKR